MITVVAQRSTIHLAAALGLCLMPGCAALRAQWAHRLAFSETSTAATASGPEVSNSASVVAGQPLDAHPPVAPEAIPSQLTDGDREFARWKGWHALRLCEGRGGLRSEFTTPFQGVPPRIPKRLELTPSDSPIAGTPRARPDLIVASALLAADDAPAKSIELPTATATVVDAGEPLPAPQPALYPRRLGLRDAIDLAVANNPDVVTARAAGPVSNAGRLVAATYPWNPSVQVEVTPLDRDISGNQLATKNVVTVSQPVELAHQRRYRIQAAEAGWSEQQALIAQAELTTSAAAMRAYFDTLYRLSIWDLTRTTAELQKRAAEATERRFVAGIATPTERMTARITERQAQRLADLARVDYQAATNTLRSTLIIPTSAPLEFDAGLEAYAWLSPTDALADMRASTNLDFTDSPANSANVIANRPDVYAARLAAVQAKANWDLARANMVPNVATGPAYERDESGTLFFGVMAQMDVPVWNTGGPLARQRAAEYQQQLIVAEQTRKRAVLQAQAAIQRYTLAYHLWREQVANAAAGEIDTVVDAFEHGQASFLEVLSVRDNLTQERKSQLDLSREVAQAAADVVAALAVDPECLMKIDSSSRSGVKK